MSRFKKILSLILALTMIVAMAAGCKKKGGDGEATTGPAGDGSPVTYTVTVKTQGGMAMKDLDVYLYADDTLSDMKQVSKTDEEGKCTFTMPQSDKYALEISGAPKGYQIEKSYGFTGNAADITLSSQLISDETLDEVAASGKTLKAGDVMRNFSVTTPAGETVTLSEMLAEKEVVLVNFWYTTCSWCVKEFPYMQEAYSQYSDKVGIIAIDSYGDSDNEIAAFQQSNGLEFPMASCPSAWASACGVSGYPTTLVVDRYGVICLVEAGGIVSLRPFISMFDTFTGDDYVQKIYTELSELVTRVLPTYQMDTSENIAAIMNQGEIEVTYRGETNDEYSWPFIAAEKNGEQVLKASNQQIDGSYAILYADVTLKAGEAVGFDYLVSSESGSDLLHVIVNDQPIYAISGVDEVETWKSCYPWVAEQDGTYEIALCYIKDDSDSVGEDTAYIKALRVVDPAVIDVPTYIPRYAAVETEEGYSYVDVVYNQNDGYYHVGTADGPLLMADLMNTTQFNEEETVWGMVNANQIVKDGKDYYEELVDYCSYASNSALTGVCTVNQELYELLQIVGEVAGYDENDPNEWLKICKYYQAYGTNGSQLQDPIAGLATFSAPVAKEGKNVATNVFSYDRTIIPRGTVMKFVPSRSGVYRITSHTENGKQVEGWIFEENMDGQEPNYVYEASERLLQDTENVYMVYYMEKGRAYYIDICFWDVYETGSIPFDIEFMGASYKVFRSCAPGYFTYDSNATGDDMYHLIALGIDIVLGDDGYYYEDLGNGTKGSPIYVDFTGITGVFGDPVLTVPAYNEDGSLAKDKDGNTVMVEGMIDKGGFNFAQDENDAFIQSYIDKHDGDIEATDKYLRELWGEEYDSYAEIYLLDDVYEGIYHGTGEDLTEEMRAYAEKVITGQSEELNGCVKVDQRLAEILQLLMSKYTFEGVDNAWLKMCYYYDTLSANG